MFQRSHSGIGDIIAVDVAQDIVSERLSPGDLLPSEASLAERFQASKVAVREATQVLEARGLIQVRHGKRSVVLDSIYWNILEEPVPTAFRREGLGEMLLDQVYAVRMLLEPEIAARGATIMLEVQVQELRRLAETMANARSTAEGRQLFNQADREFHDRIAEAVGDLPLRFLVRKLHTVRMALEPPIPFSLSDRQVLAGMHERVAAAIQARDPDAARDAMLSHLQWARQADSRSGGAPGASTVATKTPMSR